MKSENGQVTDGKDVLKMIGMVDISDPRIKHLNKFMSKTNV